MHQVKGNYVNELAGGSNTHGVAGPEPVMNRTIKGDVKLILEKAMDISTKADDISRTLYGQEGVFQTFPNPKSEGSEPSTAEFLEVILMRLSDTERLLEDIYRRL